ncbi:MAG: GDSL-type esterase/lipase family protein [Ferruginibacter sp.]
MRYSFNLLLIIAVAGLSCMRPVKKMKIVFFGDSITEQGARPNGFISKMDSMIKAQGLGESYELAGAGVSANKVYDLYLRIETDVLDKNPDVVIIYVGINDVWHKATSGTGTDPDKYERFYRAIIKKLQDKNIKVILCTPSVIGERNDNSNQQDGDLNRYSNIIRNMAKELSLPVCDLRKAFTDYLQANNPTNAEKGILTVDRVHLNDSGNMFVANEMWQVIKKIK